MNRNRFRQLPAVNEVLDVPSLQESLAKHGREAVVTAIRHEIDHARELIASGDVAERDLQPEALAQCVAAHLGHDLRPRLQTVINATGIVLHTNLGRAPIADKAAKAAYEAARGYLNLELDLETGKRSSRQNPIREWLCRLTGAESATVVNNNAAATVIALRALCQGQEVIVSRGQLIEIGGSFRIPEIMAVSGAILREVGTTNITRLSDYEKAITLNTAALLRVHTSNYRVSGFTETVSLEDLIALGKKHGLKVIDDIGSGALLDFNRFGFDGEPVAKACIAAGADLVLFSGDKLLGGPQAGILAGKTDWVQQIERDPLMRAFRCDKMTLAALEATLRIYFNENLALREIPVLHMLGVPIAELKIRADALGERLRTFPTLASVEIVEDVAYVGGGSLPDQKMKTWVVELKARDVTDTDFAQRLRLGVPAVMARVRDGKLVLDLRTIFPHQGDSLVKAVLAVFV